MGNDQERLPLERRLLIVSETFRLVERGFIHWEDSLITPEQLEQTVDTFFEKAQAAETRSEFQKVMWQLFGQLRNAHSWYSDRLVREPENGHLSFSMLELDGKWVVNADAAGMLESGDVVLSIQGKRPSEWHAELASYIGVISGRSQQILMNNLLDYFVEGNQVEVEAEDREGHRRMVVLPRLSMENFQPSRSPAETDGKWLEDGKIAYIRIPSFGDSQHEEKAIALVREFWKAKALILDVRGNGGGNTPSRLTKLLMDRPYRWWMERARHPEWLSKRHGGSEVHFAVDYGYAEWRPDWSEPFEKGDYFQGRLILLTNRWVGSAAEDFVMPFKDNGRATIVGERTWGSTGQPIFRRFGDDIQIGIGTIRAYLPNGDPFEGIGLVPDIEISYSREDLYEKRDPVLDKAIELLKYSTKNKENS